MLFFTALSYRCFVGIVHIASIYGEPSFTACVTRLKYSFIGSFFAVLIKLASISGWKSNWYRGPEETRVFEGKLKSALLPLCYGVNETNALWLIPTWSASKSASSLNPDKCGGLISSSSSSKLSIAGFFADPFAEDRFKSFDNCLLNLLSDESSNSNVFTFSEDVLSSFCRLSASFAVTIASVCNWVNSDCCLTNLSSSIFRLSLSFSIYFRALLSSRSFKFNNFYFSFAKSS